MIAALTGTNDPLTKIGGGRKELATAWPAGFRHGMPGVFTAPMSRFLNTAALTMIEFTGGQAGSLVINSSPANDLIKAGSSASWHTLEGWPSVLPGVAA
jgi:hypothetical protein